MSSRYSAARPNRAGELFARQHHGERAGGGGGGNESGDEGGSGTGSTAAAADRKIQFDVRNPSALAPDARDEDEFLEADVIGIGAAATKRGAVNLDGYDSDSETETFNARAEQRVKKRGKSGKDTEGEVDVNLLDQLDNYDKRLKTGDTAVDEEGEQEEEEDMFAGGDDDDSDEKADAGVAEDDVTTTADRDRHRRRKEVRFLDDSRIEGQEDDSKGGGQIRLDEASSSDDEDVDLAIQEEGIDEEVGPGGLKKHAPKIDAFNMRQEQAEGAFDEAGNYIRKAADPDAQHDRWLEGVSKREMKRAAAAHEKREAELRAQRRADDSVVTADVFATLIARLQRGETVLEALARLGRGLPKKAPKAKKVPSWRQKKAKNNGNGDGTSNGKNADADGAMDVDKNTPASSDTPEQAARRKDIDALTEAADRLLNRDYPDIYDTERERLMREYRAETGEDWVDPPPPSPPLEENDDAHVQGRGHNDAEAAAASGSTMWEYRWTDGRDGGARQGPFDGPTMKAWQDAGYFGDGVEFRPEGDEGGWSQTVSFA
ncbi:gyf domain containing protein [Niveomyces insectorum RCEF 264]|uniref:Gyf domain containing protein n=1 Tax=Niveomyces insectorum RCEF 264 TaxID=1081102 RepID=A0A167P6R8_9HYPO|nr:gyf domain containing protein [Niveomyces insectorum RCEF 264]